MTKKQEQLNSSLKYLKDNEAKYLKLTTTEELMFNEALDYETEMILNKLKIAINKLCLVDRRILLLYVELGSNAQVSKALGNVSPSYISKRIKEIKKNIIINNF
jgi:hypothetical protein